MVTFDELINYGRQHSCSDIHLTPGFPPVFRRAGQLFDSDFQLSAEETTAVIQSLMIPSQLEALRKGQDVDFCYQTPDGYRQRINIYQQRGDLCCALRILNETIPTIEELHLPPILKNLAMLPHGLILVTGPTGSGKSTTLASMIDYINETQKKHIITVEDPIEYVYKNKSALIHQREVGQDVVSFSSALRSAMREDPDVILVGEMRDYETISAAVTAAETGHLVLSTLHTTGAANTIDRIIDVFPPHSQGQIRAQLCGTLKGVLTQQLVPDNNGGRVAALEILIGTDAVLNMIRENKCHQLKSAMQMGTKDGMRTMNMDLARLINEGKISYDVALRCASDPTELKQYLNR